MERVLGTGASQAVDAFETVRPQEPQLLKSTTQAVQAAIAWATAAAPVIAVIAAITAVALAVQYVIKHFDGIKRAVKEIGRAHV